MKNRILANVFILAVLFSGLMVVQAGAFGPHHPRGGMFHLKAFMALDLSDSQKTEIKNILDNYKEERTEIRTQLLAARKDSMENIHGKPFNEENTRQAFRKISPIMEDAMVLKAKINSELKTILTPEQRDLLEKNGKDQCGKMEEGMQFRESMIDTWLQMAGE
jgi:Spy/CpxP family protein refolding chaperone